MSDDGETALVVIAMLGSPFSPSYARARARGGPLEPLDYSAFNVSVSRPGASRWALTERTARAVVRDRSALGIGRSSMRWRDQDTLAIDVDERSAPWGRPLRGRVLFHASATTREAVSIDGRGEHLWWPIAPLGRVEVVLDEPRLRFTGTGYLDANAGSTPLEDAFAEWSWSRVSAKDSVAITYDVATRTGGHLQHGYRIDRDGVRPLDAGGAVSLGMTRFGLPRVIRPRAGTQARVVRTVEDGPFYARSIVECRDAGGAVRGVHETVSLARFASSWVQFLIPFRMRREAA